MKQITDKKLKKLLKKPLFHASEARAMGIHPGLLSYYIKQGLIEKLEEECIGILLLSQM